TRTGSWTRTSCWPTAERGRCLPAADARLLAVLAVLAEEDDVEGGAQEDPDGAHGVTETVRAAAAQRGRAGRPDRRGGGVDGRCTHVSMAAPRPPYGHQPSDLSHRPRPHPVLPIPSS